LHFPLVSIIMPVFNAEKFIRNAIDSILQQEYVNFELIIADDGSTDGSRNIIDSYTDPRIRKIYFSTNRGIVHVTNALFDECSGFYIAVQDADDWSSEDRLLKQITVLENNKEIDIVFTSYSYTNTLGNVVDTFQKSMKHDEILDFIHKHQYLPFAAASIMFRKTVLNKVGNFRDYFNRIGAADFDWLYRAIPYFELIQINNLCYFYRNNPQSFTKTVSKNPVKMFSEKIAYFLFQERLKSGVDSLQTNNKEKIDSFLYPFVKEYKNDHSKVYRNIFKYHLYYGNYFSALITMLKSIFIEPKNKANYHQIFLIIEKIYKIFLIKIRMRD
jgi:glycosyltransferase involved in cell wall biosynthesis